MNCPFFFFSLFSRSFVYFTQNLDTVGGDNVNAAKRVKLFHKLIEHKKIFTLFIKTQANHRFSFVYFTQNLDRVGGGNVNAAKRVKHVL